MRRLEIGQAGHDLQKPAPAAVVGRLVERFLAAEACDRHSNNDAVARNKAAS
jgi:hypothetical protein